MKLRKLIRADVLRQVSQEVEMGVPVARSMTKHGLTELISRPTVVSLINAYAALEDHSMVSLEKADKIADSLFPTWLDCAGPAVQEQPYDLDYVGNFPLGRWECRT